MDEVVEAPQVAVLAVALLPGGAVLQGLALGQGCGLPKVNEPHLSAARAVMDEQEGATDDLRGNRALLSTLDFHVRTKNKLDSALLCLCFYAL